jgi:hypothetical protein
MRHQLVCLGTVAGKADDDRIVGPASSEGLKLRPYAGAGSFLIDEEDGRATERVCKKCLQRRRVATGATELVDMGR